MKKLSYFSWLIRFMIAGIFILSCNREPSATDTATQESAAPTTVAVKNPVAVGQELYQSYCVLCHGEKGDGTGSMAEMLKTPPANLTTIKARRNGMFPDEEIYKIIDGREKVASHMSGEMPVWGKTLMNAEKLSSEKQMQDEIKALVEYLKTIQQ
ncbi:MAG: c-type cytochrome [Saprospiraceae bacterium]